jgi:hypothetical protein
VNRNFFFTQRRGDAEIGKEPCGSKKKRDPGSGPG